MIGHALQDIDEVRVGVDAVQAAGDDQALDHADVLRAELRPAEQPGWAFRLRSGMPKVPPVPPQG
jgi:hypothetical protein